MSATAQGVTAKNDDDDHEAFVGSVVLEKGQKAPYFGLLLPDYRVAMISEDLKLQELAIGELEKCLEYRHKMEGEENKLSRAESFFVGTATGILVATLLFAIKR